MPTPNEFILASGSPRRHELLAGDGWSFQVIVTNVKECEGGLSPMKLVRTNALRKARAVAEQHPHSLVLGADTTVALGKSILNKPAGPEEARQMLRQLSGRKHVVHTAFILIHKADGLEELEIVSSQVTFRHLSEDMIETYLQNVHTLDKAGGYAIQEHGDLIIKYYEQPISNIIGLPIEAVGKRLKTHGFEKLFQRGYTTSVSP